MSGSVTAQFSYGLMRISQTRGGASYYGYDAGGSVRHLVDSGGTVPDAYAYDAFGNTVGRTGSTLNEFQYRGEQFDSTLGLYYLRARYYRRQSGRFLTTDPLETSFSEYYWAETPLPRYPFANSDPVGRLDPSGEAALVENLEITARSTTLVREFLKSLAATGLLYCAIKNCDEVRFSENRGKIQAQGEVFGKQAGVGVSQSWNQLVPPPIWQGLVQLGAVWVQLTSKQQRALGSAVLDAAKWMVFACVPGGGCYPPGRSFFNDYPGGRRNNAPKDANRIDIDIFVGIAFVF